ncbi:MAG: glycosyltransferase family 2 protein, partial [Acidobacteriota bacterium]
MKLSIITINYNTQPLTESLITSLLADPTLPRGIEIIVVDNNSQDDSVAFLRSDFPEVTVLDNKENVGLAAGVNRGIRQARGQYYLILNPDIIALPGSVAKLVQFMDDNDDVGIAGGKLISPNGRLQYSCYRFYRPSTIVYRRTFLGKSRAGKHETS